MNTSTLSARIMLAVVQQYNTSNDRFTFSPVSPGAAILSTLLMEQVHATFTANGNQLPR